MATTSSNLVELIFFTTEFNVKDDTFSFEVYCEMLFASVNF